MSKNLLLGIFFKEVINGFTNQMSQEELEGAERTTAKNISRVLGENWSSMPATGPTMMATVLVLNLALVPYGITPKSIAERVISTGKKFNDDQRFFELLQSAKNTASITGQFTMEKIDDLSDYSRSQVKKISDYIKENYSEEIDKFKHTFSKKASTGMNVLKSLKEKSTEKLDKKDHN